jgi:hypothetical protein
MKDIASIGAHSYCYAVTCSNTTGAHTHTHTHTHTRALPPINYANRTAANINFTATYLMASH